MTKITTKEIRGIGAMTDNQKIYYIRCQPASVQEAWEALGREAKYEVLRGMDIGVDDAWIASLIDEAKENEDEEVH